MPRVWGAALAALLAVATGPSGAAAARVAVAASDALGAALAAGRNGSSQKAHVRGNSTAAAALLQGRAGAQAASRKAAASAGKHVAKKRATRRHTGPDGEILTGATEEDAAAAVQAAEAQVTRHSQQEAVALAGEAPEEAAEAAPAAAPEPAEEAKEEPKEPEEGQEIKALEEEEAQEKKEKEEEAVEEEKKEEERAKEPEKEAEPELASNATVEEPAPTNATPEETNATVVAANVSAENATEPVVDREAEPAGPTSLDEQIQAQLSAEERFSKKMDEVEDRTSPNETHATAPDGATVPEDRLRKRHIGRLSGNIEVETGSRGLASMLAGMKMDMFRLRDKVDALERTIEDGVRLEPPSAEDTMVWPLSGCMRCVLMLTGLYFLVYTSAGLNRVFVEVFGLGRNTKAELSLSAACETVFYAPMICILFMGAHLRAMQISRGKSGPGEATELAIEACAWSVVVQTMLVLLVPVLTGKVVRIDEETGLELPEVHDTALAGLLVLVRYAAMVGLYLGVAVVCLQTVLIDSRTLSVQPPDYWDDSTTAKTEYAPPLSAAMLCTMWLTGLFFAVYMLKFVTRTVLEFTSETVREGHASGARELIAHWDHSLQQCTHAVSPAPMLCVLYMAARMRAMQLDPKTGKPQGWAEMCFYESTCAVAVHAGIIFVAKSFGIKTGGGHSRKFSDVDIDSDLDSLSDAAEKAPLPERIVFGLRIIAVLMVCWGFLGVCSSMMLINIGPGQTAVAVSPALLSAFAFAALYFSVYVCVFLSQAFAVTSFSMGVASEGSAYLLHTVHVLQEAEHSVRLCPMLAVLFIGAWMRAEVLSEFRGALQCWAGDAMYVAVAALLAMLFFAIAGGAGGARADENVPKSQRSTVTTVVAVAKAIALATLYGAVAVVAFSILVIRPETAVCNAI